MEHHLEALQLYIDGVSAVAVVGCVEISCIAAPALEGDAVAQHRQKVVKVVRAFL